MHLGQISSTRDTGEQHSIEILAFPGVDGAFFMSVSVFFWLFQPGKDKIMKKEAVAKKDVRQFTEEECRSMGARIREAREEAGMKQIELAEFLAIGKNQMYRIENGQTPCKTEYLFEISQLLGVSLDYLYFGEAVSNEMREMMEMCQGRGIREIRKAVDILRAFFG